VKEIVQFTQRLTWRTPQGNPVLALVVHNIFRVNNSLATDCDGIVDEGLLSNSSVQDLHSRRRLHPCTKFAHRLIECPPLGSSSHTFSSPSNQLKFFQRTLGNTPKKLSPEIDASVAIRTSKNLVTALRQFSLKASDSVQKNNLLLDACVLVAISE